MDEMFNSFVNLDPDLNYFSEVNSQDGSNYLTVEEYNKLCLENFKKQFKIVGYNIRSFNANFSSFQSIFSSKNQVELFSLSETWFKPHNISQIPGYNSYHTLRNILTRSGGVSIFVKNTIESIQLKEISFSNSNIEICSAKVKCDKIFLYVLAIYRPHSGSVEGFQNSLEEILGNQMLRNKSCILLGDLNVNLLNGNDPDVSNLISCLRAYHFLPVITKPTRFSDHTNSATLLDHIWINSFHRYNSGIIMSDLTDHLPTFLNIFSASNISDSKEKIEIKFRLFNNESKTKFSDDLLAFDWNSIRTSDMESYMSGFINKLNEIFCNCFPLKSKFVSERNYFNPWVTPRIRTLIKLKSNMFKWYRMGLMGKTDNNSIKNKIKTLVDQAKELYYENLFRVNSGDLSKTWKLIKNLSGGGFKNSNSIRKIVFNSQEYTNDQDIAEIFNSYFVRVGSELQATLPNCDIEPLSYITTNNTSSMFLYPVTVHECISHIRNLKCKKQSRNIISIPLLKENCSIIAPILCDILNGCFYQGVFPNCLKCATVIPIFKSGDTSHVGNYRPISLLPTLSKIYEKALYNRIVKFLSKFSILSPNQYGFMKGLSTECAVLKMVEYLYEALNAKTITLNVFIDFRKAFDLVDHGILLQKLQAYGFRGPILSVLTSYLSERKQVVKIGNCFSAPKSVSMGIPQGSCLGPLLFLIFINDLPKFSNMSTTILYADDTALLFQNSNLNDLVSIVNSELTRFSDWSTANKLIVNTEKTYPLLITNSRLPETVPPIYLNNDVIHFKTQIKYLGVIVDQNLKFNIHISEICKKISKSIGILYNMRKYLPLPALISLYYSLVYPYFIYCNLCWGNTYETHLKPLFILQKRAIRIIHQASFNSHTNSLFYSSKILKLPDINRFNQCIYVFKNFDKFETVSHNYSVRNQSQLVPRFQRTTLTQHSISFSAPKEYNALPDSLKYSTSLSVFKRGVRNHLISLYNTSQS